MKMNKIALLVFLTFLLSGSVFAYNKPYHSADFIKIIKKFGHQKGSLLIYTDSAGLNSESLEVELELNAPVYSIEDGMVTEICDTCDETNLGNYVVVEYGEGVSVKYYHLEKVYVRVGQKVKGDSKIGLAGSSGLTTFNGLGIRIERNGTPVDPNKLLHLY
jgi:septal ring factor EnvC (AmiA/AmiB activator)